jgi:hypothetical protein
MPSDVRAAPRVSRQQAGCAQAVRRLCVTRGHHILIFARFAAHAAATHFFAASCGDVHRKILKQRAKKDPSCPIHNLDRAGVRV